MAEAKLAVFAHMCKTAHRLHTDAHLFDYTARSNTVEELRFLLNHSLQDVPTVLLETHRHDYCPTRLLVYYTLGIPNMWM